MTDKVTLPCSGIDVAVRIEGEGEPVLLLHGFPDSCNLWRHQFEALTASGYRCIAPDLRGFGDTERPEGVEHYSVINVLGDLGAMLDTLEVDKAHVVGHDWGAATAWVFAAFVPERTLSLTALSVGHPRALTLAGYEQYMRSWYMFMFQFEGVAEEWLSRDDWSFMRKFGAGHPDLEKVLEDLSRPGALTASLNWYRANLPPETWINQQIEFPKIGVPTLGVWSSRDIALTEKQMTISERFVDGDWRYERIDDVGHWIPLEAPDALNDLLLSHLKGV